MAMQTTLLHPNWKTKLNRGGCKGMKGAEMRTRPRNGQTAQSERQAGGCPFDHGGRLISPLRDLSHPRLQKKKNSSIHSKEEGCDDLHHQVSSPMSNPKNPSCLLRQLRRASQTLRLSLLRRRGYTIHPLNALGGAGSWRRR